MNKVWVIADTHFGHKLMADLRGFNGDIEAHDRALIEAWNSVVRQDDTVWHLGDVYFREGFKALHRLNGQKNLCLGNHDAKKGTVLAQYFKLFGMCEVRGKLLSHMPVHEAQLRRFGLNIHGHTHASVVTEEGHISKPDRRYVSVSVEQLLDFKPIQLQHAIERGRHGT